MRTSRRSFILSTISASIAAGCATTSKKAPVRILDTHTHFYDPSRPQGVPWPPSNDTVLYRTVLPEELKRIAEPLGVMGTVVVEASPWVEDNAWVLEMAAKEPFIRGLVGHLKPGTPSFSKDLARFAKNPLFRGIRTGGWEIPIAPEKTGFIHDLSLLAERGLSLDVLGGTEQLPQIARIAAAIPNLRILINHCAGVHIDGKEPNPTWVEGIQRAAAHPKVYMKASGLAEGTGLEFSAPKDTDFYRPVLDILWKAFGEDRLIFGSNWPVSARFADYQTVLAIVQGYFNEKGLTASAKYFQKNAEGFYDVNV